MHDPNENPKAFFNLKGCQACHDETRLGRSTLKWCYDDVDWEKNGYERKKWEVEEKEKENTWGVMNEQDEKTWKEWEENWHQDWNKKEWVDETEVEVIDLEAEERVEEEKVEETNDSEFERKKRRAEHISEAAHDSPWRRFPAVPPVDSDDDDSEAWGTWKPIPGLID